MPQSPYTLAVAVDVSSVDVTLSRPCQAIYVGGTSAADLCIDFAGIKAAQAFISGIDPSTGAITAVTIGYGGQGYLTAPTVNVTGGPAGTGASLVAHLTGGVVTSITISSGGTGYQIGYSEITLTGGRSTGTIIKNVLPGTIIPVAASKIYHSGTAATNLLAMYF